MYVGDDSTIRLFLDDKNRRPNRRPSRRGVPLALAAGGLLIFFVAFSAVRRGGKTAALDRGKLDAVPVASVVNKEQLATALEAPLERNEFPAVLPWGSERVGLHYTLDRDAQAVVEKLFASYKPDYGAFVALDATTGRVLSLVSYTREPKQLGNLTLKAVFPAASIIKIVTATAAIDQSHASPDTVIAFRGGNHTLFKRHVVEAEPARGARHMTLREAFAKSVNTVFARIGTVLGPTALEEYARRFLFNQAIAGSIPVEPGKFGPSTAGPTEQEAWLMGEIASGYNRLNVMSPLQGAMIAAAVVNDGALMEPILVDRVSAATGKPMFRSEPRLLSATMTKESAVQVRTLMRETVLRGTSRKYFRQFLTRGNGRDLDVGGKTGSLSSLAPRGKCDWFVGYASEGSGKIAVAALTVNERNWRVKSSHLAKVYFEKYFDAM